MQRPKFGQRFLQETSSPFEFNAWDCVEISSEEKDCADEILKEHSTASETNHITSDPLTSWNKFYETHQTNFFKDRNWLLIEYEEVKDILKISNRDLTILEVGCGVGNSLFPLCEATENDANIKYIACDISSKAVEILKNHKSYKDFNCKAFVMDISSSSETANTLEDNSVDVVFLIFVLSAIDPVKHKTVVQNISRILKPNGLVCFRDYGKYDMAQTRFNRKNCLGPNFYVRGDGTFTYFFTQEYLKDLFCYEGSALEEVQNISDKRLQVNRRKQIKMYRVWIQCVFKKKCNS